MAEINKEQIFDAIDLIATQNLLTYDESKEVFEEAIKKAFHSKFDPDAELEMNIDKESNTFSLINHSKYVVEDEEYQEEYRALEIPLADAKKIKEDVKVGDTVSEEVDFSLYSRSIALQIKQMLTQSVREKKKEAVYAKHKSLKGEMIDVTVSSISPNFVIFTLDDNTTAFMPTKMRNMNIKLGVGQRTKVFVEDVLEESKDSQIVVSNGSKEVIKRVLEMEVPEIQEGSVEIVSISRIAGDRSKVAVKAANENIDPVGAIIGAKGTRITAIVEKLGGEKLDIILWSEDENVYVANALAPARIVSIIDKKDREGEVIRGNKIAITPDKHQTLAIGKGGSNVRLAVELANIRIDVMSYSAAVEKGIDIPWNTGLTPEELEIIESGQKLKKVLPSQTRGQSFQPAISSIDSDVFDDQIESFNSTIEEETETQTVEKENFDIDDTLFSEEELRQMEANFEFDDTLEDFEVNDEFADVNEDE